MRHLFLLALVAMTGQSFAETSVVYGDDNRKDVKDVKQISTLTKAVAGRVKNSKFYYHDDKSKISFNYSVLLSDIFGGNVCSDERFAKQKVIADCTGFLVKDDVLVTAGHCVTSPGSTIQNTVNHNCANYSWVFDFKVGSSGSYNTSGISTENVFGCKKIIYATVSLKRDFALIQLSRKTKRTPLKIRKYGKIKDAQEIFVIGHPSGLPMKFADGAKVQSNDFLNFFSTNLDTFGGNSGSPVFNAQTKKVEGILVRGRNDYVPSQDPSERCLRVNKCNEDGTACDMNGGPLEHVTRISEILNYL